MPAMSENWLSERMVALRPLLFSSSTSFSATFREYSLGTRCISAPVRCPMRRLPMTGALTMSTATMWHLRPFFADAAATNLAWFEW